MKNAVSDSGQAPSGGEAAPRDMMDVVFRFFGSVRLSLPLFFLLAMACVVGTLLPQGSDVAEYVEARPNSAQLMELLTSLGLTHVFTAWWFVALLCLLSLSLAACSMHRITVMRRSGRWQGRAVGSFMTHISLLLVLAGGAVRSVWGVRGVLELQEGETRQVFVVNGEEQSLPFGVRLEKFEIEFYTNSPAQDARILSERLVVEIPSVSLMAVLPVEVGKARFLAQDGDDQMTGRTYRVTVVRRVVDFVIDTPSMGIVSRSDKPNNPAVLVEVVSGGVTNMQWLFVRYPDFKMHSSESKEAALDLRYEVEIGGQSEPSIKDFKSTLSIILDGVVVKHKIIEVNSPLSYMGYTLYQSGYDPENPRLTILQVVRDPGVPIVYLGFFLMVVGLALIFYVWPQPTGKAASPRPGD